MPVFILLDDGTQAQVEFSDMAHIPTPGDPVQIVSLMGKLSPDVEESLLRAKCAALKFLIDRRLFDPAQGFSLALEIFDRYGQPLVNKVRGHSGGLSFALALVLHKVRCNHSGLEICATGRLDDPRTHKVKGVGGVVEKISGALSQIADGSTIFFPRDDMGKITSQQWEQAQTRKITLAPVLNMEEAIAVLESKGIISNSILGRAISAKKRRWPLVAATAFLFFYFILYFTLCPLCRILLENGRYEWAETLVEPARYFFFFNSNLVQLHKALEEPVEIKAELRSQTGAGEREMVPFTQRTRSRLALKGQASWSLSLKASESLYIYLFLRDELDELRRIFPDEFTLRDNLLPAGQEWVFPPPGYWRPVTARQGRVILILSVSRWPCKDLEGRISWRVGSTVMEHLTWRDRQGEGAWVLRLALDSRP